MERKTGIELEGRSRLAAAVVVKDKLLVAMFKQG